MCNLLLFIFVLIPFFCDMHLQAIQDLQIAQFTKMSSKH